MTLAGVSHLLSFICDPRLWIQYLGGIFNTDFTGVQISFSPKDYSVLAPLEIQSLVGHGPYSGGGSHGQAKLHT